MLSLEIVTPRGQALAEEDLAEVVFRRREERFEQGSEVAILRGHAPMLMQTSAGAVRWRDKKGGVHSRDLGEGVVEVSGDRVLVVADTVQPTAG